MAIRRYALRLMAGAALAAAGPAYADDPGGFVMSKLSYLDTARTPVNPDNLFDLPAGQLETTAVIEGKAYHLRYRFRISDTGSIGADQGGTNWPTNPAFKVQQLYIPLVSNDAITVQGGKQIRTWDQGLSYTPLGFFRSDPDVHDPLDVEGRIEGLPMLMASHVGGRLAVEAIVSDRLGAGTVAQQRNGRQIALRLSGQALGDLQAAAVVRLRDHAAPGLGGSLSYAAGRIEAHADAYWGSSEAAMRRDALFSAPAMLRTSDPLALVDGGARRVNTVVGASYSVTKLLTLGLEWAHHGDGYDGAGWRHYLANVDLARAAQADGDPRGLASLSYDLKALQQSGVRRDYAFMSAMYDGPVISLSAFALFGLADGSGTLTGSFGWKAARHLDVALQATTMIGGARSEFGMSPYKAIVSLRVIRRFD